VRGGKLVVEAVGLQLTTFFSSAAIVDNPDCCCGS